MSIPSYSLASNLQNVAVVSASDYATFISNAGTLNGFPSLVLVPNEGLFQNLNGTWTQVSFSPPAIITDSLTAAAQSTLRLVDSEVSLAYAGSTTITGSVAAVRGNATIATGTTIAGGFVYGIQGKVSVVGTLATSNYVTGLLGQLDLSNATAIGTGPLCAIWGDFGATVPGGITTDTGADILKLTNTTALGINSAIYVNAVANFFADITDIGTGGGVHMIVGTTASTAAGCLKIKVGGATRYLQIFSYEA